MTLWGPKNPFDIPAIECDKKEVVEVFVNLQNDEIQLEIELNNLYGDRYRHNLIDPSIENLYKVRHYPAEKHAENFFKEKFLKGTKHVLNFGELL